MSEHSRRVNFIWAKEAFEELERLAAARHTTTSNLIREALEEKYADTIEIHHPVITPYVGGGRPISTPPAKPGSSKNTPVKKTVAARPKRSDKSRVKRKKAAIIR